MNGPLVRSTVFGPMESVNGHGAAGQFRDILIGMLGLGFVHAWDGIWRPHLMCVISLLSTNTRIFFVSHYRQWLEKHVGTRLPHTSVCVCARACEDAWVKPCMTVPGKVFS